MELEVQTVKKIAVVKSKTDVKEVTKKIASDTVFLMKGSTMHVWKPWR